MQTNAIVAGRIKADTFDKMQQHSHKLTSFPVYHSVGLDAKKAAGDPVGSSVSSYGAPAVTDKQAALAVKQLCFLRSVEQVLLLLRTSKLYPSWPLCNRVA